MATKLYNKDGDSQMFQAEKVQGALRSGWSPVDPTKEQDKHESIEEMLDGLGEESQSVPEAPAAEVTDGQELTEEQIREMAKERGIRNYWNKNLDSLKQEMGL